MRWQLYHIFIVGWHHVKPFHNFNVSWAWQLFHIFKVRWQLWHTASELERCLTQCLENYLRQRWYLCTLQKRAAFSFVQTKDRMVITKNHHLRALGSCTAQVGLSCKNSSYYSNVSLAWFAISIKSPAAFFHLALLNKTQSHKVVRSSSTVFGLLKLIPTMVIF